MHTGVTLSAFVFKARKCNLASGLHLSMDTENIPFVFVTQLFNDTCSKLHCIRSDTFT